MLFITSRKIRMNLVLLKLARFILLSTHIAGANPISCTKNSDMQNFNRLAIVLIAIYDVFVPKFHLLNRLFDGC